MYSKTLAYFLIHNGCAGSDYMTSVELSSIRTFVIIVKPWISAIKILKDPLPSYSVSQIIKRKKEIKIWSYLGKNFGKDIFPVYENSSPLQIMASLQKLWVANPDVCLIIILWWSPQQIKCASQLVWEGFCLHRSNSEDLGFSAAYFCKWRKEKVKTYFQIS